MRADRRSNDLGAIARVYVLNISSWILSAPEESMAFEGDELPCVEPRGRT